MGEERWKVILSPRALRDLEEIVFYIASDNPVAAERFGHRLIVEAESIALQPYMGRTVPEFGDVSIRERIFRNYRIVYRLEVSESVIVVSRFWHAARDKPDLSEQ
jgi:plasmid stabilization system protein ParE